MSDAPPPNPYRSSATSEAAAAAATSSSTTSMTAPGAPVAIPPEQLERFTALMARVAALSSDVAQRRGELPAELVSRWYAWHRGLVRVLLSAQTDQLAQRAVLARLPRYEAELGRYRAAFAARGESAPERSRLMPLFVGVAGLALGLAGGLMLASSEGG